MEDKPPDFSESLHAFVNSYVGKRERAIHRAGVIFDFYARLFADERTPHHARQTVNAVLAYFVAPEDMMPEQDLGPIGMLDDLYVATTAYRRLRRDIDGQILLDAWHGENDLEDVMAEVYAEARSGVGKLAKRILELAGL